MHEKPLKGRKAYFSRQVYQATIGKIILHTKSALSLLHSILLTELADHVTCEADMQWFIPENDIHLWMPNRQLNKKFISSPYLGLIESQEARPFLLKETCSG